MTAQLVHTTIPRVDAVDEPATAIPFLLLKSANLSIGDPAMAEKTPAAPAATDPVAKSDTPAEPVEKADSIDLEAAAAAAVVPGSPEWEAVDADQAKTAVEQLVGLKAIVEVLSARESAEGDWENEWNLDDAACALDFVLSVLAPYALTEEAASQMVAKATKLAKALLPAQNAPAEVVAQLDVAKAALSPSLALAKAIGDFVGALPVMKADDGAEEILPPGLKELLDTFIAGYVQLQTGAPAADPAAVSPAETEAPGAAPVADAEAAPAPVEDAAGTEGDPETPGEQSAKTEDTPADNNATPEQAPVDDAETLAQTPDNADGLSSTATPGADENPLEEVKKALATEWDARLREAVAKHTEPLLKRINTLESTPMNDGPLLYGQTPATAGLPASRGQEGGLVAKSAAPVDMGVNPFTPSPVAKSAATGRDLGNPVAAGLTEIWQRGRA